MENKNLMQVLRKIGMSQREAGEEIRKTGVEEPDMSNYTKKSRKVYDILSPLYSR